MGYPVLTQAMLLPGKGSSYSLPLARQPPLDAMYSTDKRYAACGPDMDSALLAGCCRHRVGSDAPCAMPVRLLLPRT
eukprot:3197769-Rhodomonas_salina.4